MTIQHFTGLIDPAMVERMCADLGHAMGTRRKTVERELLRIGGKLQDIRADLAGDDANSGKLGAGFDYLNTLAGDDLQREAIWCEWLAQYEAVCDLQSRIAATVLRQEAA